MNDPDWLSRPAYQWRLEDVQQLAQAEEGLYLEFKKPTEFLDNNQYSRDRLAGELAETASAFLNSQGGVLLIGVQTTQSTTDRRVEYLRPTHEWDVDGIWAKFGINVTTSQISVLIYGNLSPRPVGIEVQPVEVDVPGTTTTAFAATVPVGTQAYQSSEDLEVRSKNGRR